ncbi:MAG: siroheme synthase [Alphaproteobacteria bacterium]|nr:siroheme synthase [Alphaproteobacteria bacterium]
MERLPIFVDVRDKPVLLLGEGPPAEAKARLLTAAGARLVTARTSEVRLAVVALDAPEAVAAELRAAGLLVNVVDRPELCDFTMPAIVDRAPVTVAIGTAAASATLAKALRERFEALLPATLGALAAAIRTARPAVAAKLTTPDSRRRFWDALTAPGAALDPLAPAADPAAAIAAALEAPEATPAPSLEIIRLAGDDPEDLTLRQLRLLSQADTVFHGWSVAPVILDRARRDARVVRASAPPATLPPGRSLYLVRG